MIEIRYNSKPRIFELVFNLHEYIPQKYFELSGQKAGAELSFFIDLFTNNNMIVPKKASAHQLIWSVSYDCFYKDTPFTMVYDEDYDLISFIVEDPDDRIRIAEIIKDLVENNRFRKVNEY